MCYAKTVSCYCPVFNRTQIDRNNIAQTSSAKHVEGKVVAESSVNIEVIIKLDGAKSGKGGTRHNISEKEILRNIRTPDLEACPVSKGKSAETKING